MDPGVSSDPGARDRQLETLPWTSPARTRKAYRCPFDPGKMALVLVTPVSQPFQAPPSTETWPQLRARTVEAERPDPHAAQPRAIHEVIAQPERCGVVDVQLPPGRDAP